MRSRLAAAAAGAILIAAAISAFSLSSHPVIAGTNTVEPVLPTAWQSDRSPSCQTLSRVPPGADRLRIVVTLITGGARDLHVEIVDAAGSISAGDLHKLKLGENVVKLSPKTRAAHPASLCLSNSGAGQIVVAGEDKRVIPGTPKGKETEKHGVPSAIFLRPGSSSWVAADGHDRRPLRQRPDWRDRRLVALGGGPVRRRSRGSRALVRGDLAREADMTERGRRTPDRGSARGNGWTERARASASREAGAPAAADTRELRARRRR